VKQVAALVLAPLLTLGIAVGATRLVGGQPTSPRTHAHGVVWGKRTFVNRAELGRWLDSHGRSYEVWARRHPVEPKADRPVSNGSTSLDSTIVLAVIAVLALGGLALLARRRRRPPLHRLSGRVRRPSLHRPRLASSHALAWRGHPDLAWYLAGGALAVGAGLAVAGWS
jgi:MYXO-CTERM domain-containing protein